MTIKDSAKAESFIMKFKLYGIL